MFIRNGGEAREGGGGRVGFTMGRGWEILKFLYIVGRGVLTPLFYEDPPIFSIPPF